jgi:hypothetical protein
MVSRLPGFSAERSLKKNKIYASGGVRQPLSVAVVVPEFWCELAASMACGPAFWHGYREWKLCLIEAAHDFCD